eukprot:scaffold93793_cov34-Prasinocladus_malaysianus.AAC.1
MTDLPGARSRTRMVRRPFETEVRQYEYHCCMRTVRYSRYRIAAAINGSDKYRYEHSSNNTTAKRTATSMTTSNDYDYEYSYAFEYSYRIRMFTHTGTYSYGLGFGCQTGLARASVSYGSR